MILKSVIKKKFEQKFERANLTGVSHYAHRDGYYVIKSLGEKSIGKTINVPVAEVYWKASFDDFFIDELIHELR